MIAWVEILIIVGINTSCGFMWNTFASVPTTSANWMNVSLTRINWLSNAAAIINTIFSFFAAWSYERLGLKISILLGAVLNTIGCWVRCIAIILPAERRYLALYGLPPKIVELLIPYYLIVIASMSTVFTIPAFFMPNKPKIPPSVSATVERTPILEGIKQLSKNIQFWWVTFIASISMGLAFSVSVLIIEAIAPFGYSEQQAGICASLIVFSGSIGGIRSDAFSIVIVACILNGFLSYSMVPVYLELATEITYPVSESVSSCILWTLSSITMVIFSIIIDALRAGGDASPPHNMSMSMIAVVIIIIIGNLPCLWLKGELKRAQVDNNFNNSNKPC
ncbi:hypothetical protein BDF20DRAFT_907066 [Mycotypha africana]|uniref:uncharacterized protein n=1 Tax=Mycotypha africana TaxID=64632 RepID=UPI0023017B9A|nr:uncharacterized protein BDF20DRAFT_907066 [Mycotypha africana]KAI8973497.1 hypothetical protein BDF20DRAFT_907066 [Mycotypha africana]